MRSLEGDGFGIRIVLTCVAMWDFSRLNKKKIGQCLREGIDESRRSEFAEMGNESPLFRCVIPTQDES